MKSIITIASKPGTGSCKIIHDTFKNATIVNCATVSHEDLSSLDFNEVVVFEEIDRAPDYVTNFIIQKQRAINEFVEELTGFITQPRFQHDCTTCHFLGQYKKYDLYFCPNEPTIVARFSDGQDYNSGMAFAVTSLRNHYREAVIRALRIPEFKGKIIEYFTKYHYSMSRDNRKERFLELVKIAETDPKDYPLLLGQLKYFMSYIEEYFKEHAEEEGCL